MKLDLQHAHRWQITPAEAIALQHTMAPLVREEPLSQPLHTIAGVDMSVRGDEVQAAVVVLSLPELLLIEQSVWRGLVEFPYVPGLLSFRETPAILRALEQLQVQPDVVMTDSQGRAHPRRFGLACHLGVLLDWPVFGVAKSKLTGVYTEPANEPGVQTPLTSGKDIIGAVVRTKARANPVYVSVGHRITLPEAVNLTLACTKSYRLPEPTRQAHLLSKRSGGDEK